MGSKCNERRFGFFVPARLVKFEYLVGDNKENKNIQKDEYAGKFIYEKNLAFFVVNFGYTPDQFGDLTYKEMLFIRKEWENKKILDSQLFYKALATVSYNENRKKGKKAKSLWDVNNNKQYTKKYKQTLKDNLTLVKEINAKEKEAGFDWYKYMLQNM
ncbi:MAG TPA: hypothetical protein IAC41_09075 [Candidatus Merdenecus merdavium]|nr:hypothetical protein [Candidatus Merdenecus merdavium]